MYGQVTDYSGGANGNVFPIRTISGSNTGLTNPYGIAVDASRNIYVLPSDKSIIACAAGAHGNVAPIRTIAGSKTRLSGPIGIAVDASSNIYVVNNNDDSVTVYAAGAKGNVAPIQTIIGPKPQMHSPYGIAVDAKSNIYVVNNNGGVGGSDYGSVTVYVAGATGNILPIRQIGGNNPGLDSPVGLALDASDNLYILNDYPYSGSVLRGVVTV